jgi:hypothetical protein
VLVDRHRDAEHGDRRHPAEHDEEAGRISPSIDASCVGTVSMSMNNWRMLSLVKFLTMYRTPELQLYDKSRERVTGQAVLQNFFEEN